MAEYVIIGNGSAAVGCIEGIRKNDLTSPITVISAEEHPVYCRPLISYYLEGKTDLERMSYRPKDFYGANGCRVLYGRCAVAFDSEKMTVSLDDGSTLPYTKLCIATGSSPFVPPMKGLEKVEKRFTFMTLDDALSLEQTISAESRVLIVGAGLIGLKCAEGIVKRVASITVCDLADRVLSSILDEKCAGMMQKRLEESGIKFMLSDTVEEFCEGGATMRSGARVDFDVLVLALGVRPNTAIAKEAGAQTERGIRVDERMQTSLPCVYAAGDCAEGMDISCGKSRVLAIMPVAYMQGHTAGVNMAGGDAVLNDAIPMNSIGFFGLHAVSAGSYFDESEGGSLYEECGEGYIKRMYIKDDLLTGYMLIGNVERAGIYTSLIRQRVPLKSINFDILKKSPTLFAYSEKNRGKILGGVV